MIFLFSWLLYFAFTIYCLCGVWVSLSFCTRWFCLFFKDSIYVYVNSTVGVVIKITNVMQTTMKIFCDLWDCIKRFELLSIIRTRYRIRCFGRKKHYICQDYIAVRASWVYALARFWASAFRIHWLSLKFSLFFCSRSARKTVSFLWSHSNFLSLDSRDGCVKKQVTQGWRFAKNNADTNWAQNVSAEVVIVDVLLFKETAGGSHILYMTQPSTHFLPCRYAAKNSSKEEIASNLAVVGALGLMSYPTYHRPFQYFK